MEALHRLHMLRQVKLLHSQVQQYLQIVEEAFAHAAAVAALAEIHVVSDAEQQSAPGMLAVELQQLRQMGGVLATQGAGFELILGLGRLPVMRIGAAFDTADEGQAEVFGVGAGKPVARARA